MKTLIDWIRTLLNRVLAALTYRQLRGAGWAIVVLLALLLIPSWYLTFRVGDSTLHGSTFVFLALLGYLGLSIKVVGPEELAGTFFYGRRLERAQPGPHFIPFGLMQMRKESGRVVQFQEPDDPEKVFKGHDHETLPPGMVRPIRVVTGGKKRMPAGASPEEALHARLVLMLSFYVQVQIDDIFQFIANYGSMEVIKKHLRDIAEAELAEIASGHTPASFIKDLKRINQRLKARIDAEFHKPGVRLVSVQLISPDLSHGVSAALASVPTARLTAEATVITAEADKEKELLAGDARAANRRKELLAEADGETAMYGAKIMGRKGMVEALGVDGATVLASESVRDLSEKTDVILAGASDGARDLLGLVAGAKRAFTSKEIPK